MVPLFNPKAKKVNDQKKANVMPPVPVHLQGTVISYDLSVSKQYCASCESGYFFLVDWKDSMKLRVYKRHQDYPSMEDHMCAVLARKGISRSDCPTIVTSISPSLFEFIPSRDIHIVNPFFDVDLYIDASTDKKNISITKDYVAESVVSALIRSFTEECEGDPIVYKPLGRRNKKLSLSDFGEKGTAHVYLFDSSRDADGGKYKISLHAHVVFDHPEYVIHTVSDLKEIAVVANTYLASQHGPLIGSEPASHQWLFDEKVYHDKQQWRLVGTIKREKGKPDLTLGNRRMSYLPTLTEPKAPPLRRCFIQTGRIRKPTDDLPDVRPYYPTNLPADDNKNQPPAKRAKTATTTDPGIVPRATLDCFYLFHRDDVMQLLPPMPFTREMILNKSVILPASDKANGYLFSCIVINTSIRTCPWWWASGKDGIHRSNKLYMIIYRQMKGNTPQNSAVCSIKCRSCMQDRQRMKKVALSPVWFMINPDLYEEIAMVAGW